MSKQEMNKDDEHPTITKNKKKRREIAEAPLVQGNAKSGKKKVEEPHPSVKNKGVE